MKISRVGGVPRQSFVAIPNSTVRDDRLTYADRGLLAELLSHADKFDFKMNKNRDAKRSSLRRLEQANYVKQTKYSDPRNRGRYAYTLQVSATPCTDWPPVVSPSVVEPVTAAPQPARARTYRRPLTKKIEKKKLELKKSVRKIDAEKEWHQEDVACFPKLMELIETLESSASVDRRLLRRTNC
jgi:hypothetical protein